MGPQLPLVTSWEFSPKWLQLGCLRTSMFLSRHRGCCSSWQADESQTLSDPDTQRGGRGGPHEG